MKTEVIRLCQFCGCIMHHSRNCNSKYCSNDCYNLNKAKLAELNNKNRAMKIVLLDNDEILDSLYKQYGSSNYIKVNELKVRNFNWSIYSGETLVNNIKANTIIRYGYTLFTNQTVQIWKL